jgi:hypothetical protein
MSRDDPRGGVAVDDDRTGRRLRRVTVLYKRHDQSQDHEENARDHVGLLYDDGMYVQAL